MRKLGLLALCTLLFGVLFYTLVQTTPTASPAKSSVNASSPLLADVKNSSSTRPSVSLRMDNTLGQIPALSTERNFSAPPLPAKHALSPYLNPGTANQFALLAAALALGWLTSRIMRPATTIDAVPRAVMPEPEHAREADQNLDSIDLADMEHAHTQLRETQQLLDSDAASHADELVAVNDLLDSREIELSEGRDRLTMLDQIVAELREELTQAQQRYDALSSTQQDQLERYELEKHDTILAYTTEIDEFESEIESLRLHVDKTQQELESKDSLLAEVQQTVEKTTASKDELELQLQDVTNELADKIRLADDLVSTNNSLSERLAELQDQATLAEKQKEELDLLSHNFDELVTARDSLIEQFDALDHNFTVAHNRALEADELEDELKNLKDEVERVTTSKDEHIIELGEMHTLFNQAQSRAAEADQLEDQVSQVITDLESVAAARDTAEQRVTTLNDSLSEVTEKLELALSQLNEKEHQAQASQAELENLREELDQLNEVLLETQELFESKQDALLILQQNFDSLSREEQELRDEHNELIQQSSKVETENEALTESVNLLRQDLVEMVHKIGEKNTVVSGQQEQLADEQNKVKTQQAEIEILLGSVASEHEKLKGLNVELEEAKATELRLLNWDNSLQTYRNDITDKNKLIDQLRDCVSEAVSQSSALQEQANGLEEKLKNYEGLQSELASTRDAYAGVGETLEQQQRLAEQLSELGKEHEEVLAAQTQSLNEIQIERQQWLEQLTLKTNTAAELEADLLDQHDVFLTVEELIDETLSKRGVTPGVSASFEPPENVSQRDSVLVRKGHALIGVLEKTDSSNKELATLQESLERQLEESSSHISELNSIQLGQSSEFDNQRKDLQEQLQAAANEHQGLLAELEEIREARDVLATTSQEQEANAVQLEQELQAHIEQLERQHQSDFVTSENERTRQIEQLEKEHKSQLDNATEAHATELTRTAEELAKAAEDYTIELAKATEEHANNLANTTDEHADELAKTIEERTVEFNKQQQLMQEQLDIAANEHQELLAELEEVRLQRETTSAMSADQATQIGKLTNELDEANQQLHSHTEQFNQYQNSLDTAEQKVAEAEEVWAETDTALQASETALKQKDYELSELRDLLKTVERVNENDRVKLEQTEKELELKRRSAAQALEALTAAREESETITALRNEAITELTQQQNRYSQLEQSLKLALHEQRQDNARLRAELATQKERVARSNPVPILTQKIKGGGAPGKVPVLEQPLAGTVKSDQSRIPVLKKPFDPGNS